MIIRAKKIAILSIVILVVGIYMAAVSAKADNNTSKDEGMAKKTRVILIGASVGQEWHLADFPKRTGTDQFVFESVAVWKYDKTEALEEVLMRPKRKFHPTRTYLRGFFKPSPVPADIIILKECSAYFPGDLSEYKALMKKWVSMVRSANKEVMIATVAPVTETRAAKQEGKIESIRAFNDWVRQYARDEGITVLDLEAALRTDPEKRYLKDDLTSGDGTHLNQKAYVILDALLSTLCRTSL